MDTLRANSVLIRRKGLILSPHWARIVVSTEASRVLVATFCRNIQSLGYILAPLVIKRLARVEEDELVPILGEILSILRELKGVHAYRPMYPNFPKQVMEASDAELYINAILHYLSVFFADVTGDKDYIWLPKYRKEAREPLDEKIKLRVLGLGYGEDLLPLARQIARSNTSLSEADRGDLGFLVDEFPLEDMQDGVANKETLAFLGAIYLNRDYAITPAAKTATDVLRLAVALSGGDLSLAEPCKFRGFKRAERRKLLSILESCGSLEEDMLRWEGRWLRLAEKLHPGDYCDKYKRAFTAINALRNGTTAQTLRSKVEESVRAGHVVSAVKLLSDRPGDFGRRLDHLLRKARTEGGKAAAAEAFLDVAAEASTPVLLQMMSHFDHRQEGGERTVFPKGSVAKVTSIPELPELDEGLCKLVSRGIRNVLRKRFSALPSLGKVYVDPTLKDYLLPFSQRSASKSLRTLVRGSRVAFGDEKNTIRLFIWWKDLKEVPKSTEGLWSSGDGKRVDLDLSAVAYREDWTDMIGITYYNLRDDEIRSCHSGDITSAPKGASEFIDVDINSALAAGYRYIVMNVNSFTRQEFCDIPEASAGWMLRAKPQSGEVFDPRTVVDRIDIAMKAKAGIPMIADLKERKVIWADAAMTVNRYRSVNVHNNRGTVELLGKALTNVRRPTMYDLLSLHAKARGTVATDPKDADTVFSVAAGTPFELERIASEFMADPEKKKKKKEAVA